MGVQEESGRPEDIEPAIKEMLNTNGPYLIDLVVRES